MSEKTARADGALIITPRDLKLFSLDNRAHAPSEVTFADNGTEHKFTATPSRLRLGEDGGALFGHAAEDAASQLVSNATEDRRAPQKTFLNMFRDSAKLARGAVDVLLAAGLAVALMIDATAGVRSQTVFAAFSTHSSKEYPLNFHADDFKGGLLRSVHVSSGSPDSHVVFGISAFNWSNDPLLKETFIGGVNVGGLLCYAEELIKAGETYLLNREGAGDVVLFFLKGGSRWRGRVRAVQAGARCPARGDGAARPHHDVFLSGGGLRRRNCVAVPRGAGAAGAAALRRVVGVWSRRHGARPGGRVARL